MNKWNVAERWVFKYAALAYAYGGPDNYHDREARFLQWQKEHKEIVCTMKRPSDRNKEIKLRFGQAVMLGCEFEVRVKWGHRRDWYVTLPYGVRTTIDFVNGGYSTRYAAACAALGALGVDYDGNRKRLQDGAHLHHEAGPRAAAKGGS